MTYKSYSYPMLLHVLTPVIINTGEAYEPFSICPGKDEDGLLIRISELGDYISPTRYSRLFEIACYNSLNPNYVKDMNLFREADAIISEALRNAENKKQEGRVIIGKCKILPEAKGALAGNRCRIVSKHATNPLNEKPFIPGSSIKGAIRTALLEELRKGKNLDDIKDNRKLEARLLYDEPWKSLDPRLDPLKYLKVSDFVFEDSENCSWIGKVNAGGKIPVYTGMTDAMSFYGKDIIAKGSITIIKQNDTPYWLDYAFILKAVNGFYWKMCVNKIRKSGLKLPVTEKVYKTLTEQKPNTAMLRLGHYIGVENVTLNVQNPVSRLDNINGSRKFVTIESGVAPGYCLLEGDNQ